jgi:hypothetical protein
MARQILRNVLLCGTGLALTACGGGGGSSGTAFIPTPPATPTLPPPPATPLPPAHIGLVSSAPFAVLAVGDTYKRDAAGRGSLLSGPAPQNVQFVYDPANNAYVISLPGFPQGVLGNTAYNGTSGQIATGSFSQVLELAFGVPQSVSVTLPVPGSNGSPYTYTSLGTWSGQSGTTATGEKVYSEGIFAYGIPTAVGDVPVTGTAAYTAEIVANYGPDTYPPNGIGGNVNLTFNFGAGTLSGSMHPQIIDGFDGIFVDFGKYDFTQTVYSTGSTTFSGKFVVPGLPNADSFFNGNFTGPGAAELMARFQTPFILNGNEGTISGIWIGKKN